MSAQDFTLDQFNEGLRQSQFYKDWMRAHGVNLAGPIRLTDQQRKAFQRDLMAIGVPFDKGIEIDPAGNMNQDEGFSRHKKWMIPAAIAVGTLGLGAAGIGPAAGLFGASGPASALTSGAAMNATIDSLAAGSAGAGAGAGAGALSFSSMVPSLVGTGGKLAGDFFAGRAASRAADVEAQAAREALDFEKGVYADEQRRLTPYRELGSQAYQRMGKILGLEPLSPSATAPLPTNSVDRMFALSRQSAQSGTPAAPTSGAQPRIGDRKNFPNGRIGEWDGKGWMAVS